MKRFVLMLALMLFAWSARAQEADSVLFSKPQIDTASQWQQTTDGGLATLHAGDKPGTMAIDVAGFSLTLAPDTQTSPESSHPEIVLQTPRYELSIFTDMEFGFTQLCGLDYGGYPYEQRGFLDQRLWSSFHIGIAPVQFGVVLNRRRSLRLQVGFQFAVDLFNLANRSITLGNSGGKLTPVSLESSADASKFATATLGIPVRLRYTPVKHLHITATAYSDFMVQREARLKNSGHRERERFSGISTYQLGAGLAVTYYGIGLFARYSLTPFFNHTSGLTGHTLTFGLALYW